MRLTVAFLAVAMAAVAVFAAAILLASRAEVSTLSDRRRQEALDTTAAAASVAFSHAGGWAGADLIAASAIAAQAQATLVVLNADGSVLAAPTDQLAAMMASMHGVAVVEQPRGDPVSAKVVVDGRAVGAVMLRFPVAANDAEAHVRNALSRATVTGLLLAGVVAVVVAVNVSLRVTRPVKALILAADDLTTGRRGARVPIDKAPGELRQLATAFNAMADHLDREDQLRRNLLADVAHELRTPLTILQGNTEAILDGVDEPSPAAIASLHDETVRLGRLVADLETLAAAEAAGLRLELSRVDLADVVRATLTLLAPLAAERNVTLRCTAEPAVLDGDSDRLQQVVVNLVGNAIKFTPAGGTVTLTTRGEDGTVELIIDDTGPGLYDDELENMFKRFWRGRNAASGSGSGIGLAVVTELVAAHHGTIAASNRPEGGARFVVTLPGSLT